MSAGVIEQGLHENSQNVIELGRMAIGDLLEEQVFLGVEVIDAGLEPVQGEDEGILVEDTFHVPEVGLELQPPLLQGECPKQPVDPELLRGIDTRGSHGKGDEGGELLQ